MPTTHKGVLDHLEQADRLLAQIDLTETLDLSRRRDSSRALINARAAINAAVFKLDHADALGRDHAAPPGTQHRGVLDHLARCDRLLARVDVAETMNPTSRNESLRALEDARIEIKAAITTISYAVNAPRKP